VDANQQPENDHGMNLVKNAYRTSARHQMDERRLILRGGPYDGRTWSGVVSVGQRQFVGDGDWAPSGVYVVTAQVETGEDGEPANVAVPAFA
jgi:hypothetical protein